MSATEPLLRVADAYREAEGLADKTVSSRVFKDSKKLGAMREGADITMTRFAEAMEWFSRNWPDSAEWPEGVDRPQIAEAA